jgi:hypothetical protein
MQQAGASVREILTTKLVIMQIFHDDDDGDEDSVIIC